MITDEGGYAYVASFWSDRYQLYRDLPFGRPQAIFLLYKAVFALAGRGVEPIRFAAAVCSALCAALLWVFSRDALGKAASWWASALYAVFSASPSIEGFTANAETFMSLPLIVSAHLVWRHRWGWAGFAAALAVLFKPSGLSALGLGLLVIAVSRAGWTALARIGVGFVLGAAPSVAHGAAVGWRYYWTLLQDRPSIGWRHDSALFPEKRWLVLYHASRQQLQMCLAALRETSPALATCATASGITLVGPRLRATHFGWLWLACSFSGVAMGGWWRPHYFIQVVPALAFLAAAGLSTLRPRRLRILWFAALAMAFALFVQRDAALGLLPPRALSWAVYHRPGYLVSDAIASRIRQLSSEEDTLQVCFAEAELYFLSSRRAAYPQLYFLHAEYSAEVFDGVRDVIARRVPRVIVRVQEPPANRMSSEAFSALLDRGYDRDSVFQVPGAPPLTLYRRR